ncbi:MAG: energy-coupling factor ABC transporter permease [Spirochaetaceae bacterium]|jgi:cobalt/nickel transport system permease protein|nr:energy-coupling factor ABC transporter permease [Spirochaetaceae bacterium]
MHISEGVLSPPVLAAGWALTVGGLAFGLKKTAVEKLPETALVSAALFLASLVHVPVGPSSIHLTLLGLAGILLGWSAVPALFIALLLQGLLFQFGGLLSLGVNTAVMGTAALTGSGVYRILLRISSRRGSNTQSNIPSNIPENIPPSPAPEKNIPVNVSAAKRILPAFMAGFVAVIAGTVLVCAALFFSYGDLLAAAAMLFAANLPLALVEGVISAFIAGFLSKTLPQYVS